MERQKLVSVTKDDLVIQFYKASGKGGQKRNKCETACRMSHPPSGVTVTCCDERSQLQNKRKAFKHLVEHPDFRRWLKIESCRAAGTLPTKEHLEKEVEEMMKEENLKIEYL